MRSRSARDRRSDEWVAISPTTMHVVVRTTLPLATLAPAIARVVRDVDAAVPVARLREMDEVFTESIRRPRLLAQLRGRLRGPRIAPRRDRHIRRALSYMVTERRREIGIRMALGANRSRVTHRGHEARSSSDRHWFGAGLAGALGLNRLIASLLFGVEPTDTSTVVAVILTISVMAVVASGLPAWRASRLDPNVALRED